MRMLHPPQWRVDPFFGSVFDIENSISLYELGHNSLLKIGVDLALQIRFGVLNTDFWARVEFSIKMIKFILNRNPAASKPSLVVAII